MNRKKWTRFLWIVLLILWLAVIFVFSAQPAEESQGVSDGICYKLAAFMSRLLGLNYRTQELEWAAEWLSFPIRKAAHMTEYAVLALLVYRNIRLWKEHLPLHRCRIASWLAVVVCAALDEFHQLFVPGRCGTPKDVCIDAAGAAVALLLCYLQGRNKRGNESGKK